MGLAGLLGASKMMTELVKPCKSKHVNPNLCLDGLLAVGRSASGIPDTLLRNRMAAKTMGEAGGVAAAMSAASGVTPKTLDVRQLQSRLLDCGFYLGDRRRLKDLGLV